MKGSEDTFCLKRYHEYRKKQGFNLKRKEMQAKSIYCSCRMRIVMFVEDQSGLCQDSPPVTLKKRQ